MRIAFVPFVVTSARMPIHPRRADSCEYFRDVTTENMWTMCLPQINESRVSSSCCSSYFLLYLCVNLTVNCGYKKSMLKFITVFVTSYNPESEGSYT